MALWRVCVGGGNSVAPNESENATPPLRAQSARIVHVLPRRQIAFALFFVMRTNHREHVQSIEVRGGEGERREEGGGRREEEGKEDPLV